jgi:hypothetical protein
MCNLGLVIEQVLLIFQGFTKNWFLKMNFVSITLHIEESLKDFWKGESREKYK